MSAEFITFTDENERYLKRGSMVANELIPAESLRAATERALQPGLIALQAETRSVGVKTGRLRAAPGVKFVGRQRGGFRSIIGMVGFRSGFAPHDWYVEYGTRLRRGRGIMPAAFLSQKAFDRSRGEITSIMRREMTALAEQAARRLAAG
jgi:hypothetical protein